MFVRRSRRGRIHVVRERVADGYARLSKGLARANKGVIDGVWSVHKGLQLGLAKGHQGVQSGLKIVEDFTGDFNMYYQGNSYYQYQPSMAMFSMAEVDKYNKYNESGDYAYFTGKEYFKTKSTRVNKILNQKLLPGSGGTSAGSTKARWQRTSRNIGEGVKSVGRGIGGAAKGFASGAAAIGSKPLDWTGRRMGEAAYKVGQMGGDNVIGKAGKGAYGMVSKNPRLAGALALGGLAAAGAAGAGGAMFLRRRRTKKGKVVVEQVRR